MFRRLSFFTLLCCLIISACAPAPASPTPPPTTPITPTITPSPAPSATPTITPFPSLQTQGPYILFTHDQKTLTMMDADGSGRKQIQIPDDGEVGWDLNNSVSPDGKWLAYFTGSTDKPYDLALNLFNLKDETTFPIANLLAPGYPENLMQTTLNKDLCPDDIPDCQAGAIRADFEAAITRTIAWSPDSTTLAFAAQIDGPSSDVYLFKLKDRSIRRLVNDLENLWSIEWSPKGKKILYENFESGNYTTSELHIADPNIAAVQSPRLILSGPFWGIAGWVDDNLLLIYDSGDGGAPHNFRYLNIKTQQTKSVWKYECEMFAASSEVHGVIFTLPPEVAAYYETQMEPGTYFVSVDGKPIKISDKVYQPLQQSGLPNSFFIERGSNLYTVKIDGFDILQIKGAVDFTHSPRLSPDKKWLMVEGFDGLQLYSENLELIKSWEIRNSEMIWRPDSAGLLLFMDTAMYYLPIPDGEPTLIEDCAPDYCSLRDYVWFP